MLKAIFAFCQKEDVRRRVVFLEDYDLVIARYLVQGVDIWLNTPRRGMEASGTSGMKVLPNGGLNLSILDGWWCEGYQSEAGWAIGKGEEYADHVYQGPGRIERALRPAREDIVPLFYWRGVDGLPRPWISRMKNSMKLTPNLQHQPHALRVRRALLSAGGLVPRASDGGQLRARAGRRELEGRSSRSTGAKCASRTRRPYELASAASARASRCAPTCGSERSTPRTSRWRSTAVTLDTQQRIHEGVGVAMRLEASSDGGAHRYVGVIPCERTGMFGWTVRVRPNHAEREQSLLAGA